MLSTGVPGFYEPLGWERWRGPSFVIGPDGRRRTEDEDGGVMVLRCRPSAALDPHEAIACQERDGDDW